MWWFCVLLFATASGRPDETQRSTYVSSDAAASALSSSKDNWPGTQLNSHYNPNSINGQGCMQPGGMSKVVQGDVYYDCVCVPNETGSLVLECSPCDRCSRRNFQSHLPNVISVNPIIALPVIPEHSERVLSHPMPVPSPPVPVPPPFNPAPSPPIPVPSDPIPVPPPPIAVPSPPVPVPPPFNPVPSPPIPVPSAPVPSSPLAVPFPSSNQYISDSYGHLMIPESRSSISTPVPVPFPLKPVPYPPVPVPSPFNSVPYPPIPVLSPFDPVPSPPVPTPLPFKPSPSSPVPVPSPFDPVPVPPTYAPVSFPPVSMPPSSVPVPFSYDNQYISGSDGHLIIPASISSVFTPVPVPSPFKPLLYSPVPVPTPPMPVPSSPIPIPSPFNPVPVPSQPVPVPPLPVPVPSPAGFIPSYPGNWYISGHRVLPITGIPGSTGNNEFVNSRTSDTSSAATSSCCMQML